MEKLTTTFGAFLDLFRYHEIHETAFATSHYQNMVLLCSSSIQRFSRGCCRSRRRRGRLRRRFFTVV
uniref:Uncharacterized protein n=1 Tax=Cannabis sativa TaxID=3483 RepID=A0A803RC03_CANSA